jgi:hypothetical protein
MSSPKILLNPRRANDLRSRTETMTAGVSVRVSWAHLVEALQESGNLRDYEQVEALVLDDNGINIFLKDRKNG